MFSWQKQYFTCSLRSLVRFCFCHSNIKFISSRHRVISSTYKVICIVNLIYIFVRSLSISKIILLFLAIEEKGENELILNLPRQSEIRLHVEIHLTMARIKLLNKEQKRTKYNHIRYDFRTFSLKIGMGRT